MLTVIILTLNEETALPQCLDSLSWIEDKLVFDSGSTDRTCDIAREYGARVVQRSFDNYAAQRNAALCETESEWVLFIDADERVGSELVNEIHVAIQHQHQVGWKIPRHNYIFGKLILNAGWYPDYQLRLYDRRVALWNSRYVHESVSVNGTTGTLRSEIRHYAYDNMSDHLSTINHYSTLAAKQMLDENRRARWTDLAVHPGFAFVRNYVLRGGFRDGLPGLLVSLMNSYYVFLKFAKLWEQNSSNYKS